MSGSEMLARGMADLSELTRPRQSGRAVDMHVVVAQRERVPDFERMRQLTSQGWPGDAHADLKDKLDQ